MMNLMEAMAIRHSTRSFDGGKLSATESAALSRMLESVSREVPPFCRAARLALYDCEAGGGPARLGTYGLISGASAFIVPAVVFGRGAMEDAGYILERAVLEATAMGWASCWIGGVFSRAKAAEAISAREGELTPAVVALGRPAPRRSLADKLVAGASRARTRKPLEEIVFSADGVEPDPRWLEPEKALQGAPSASNKQPWRLVKIPSGDEWVIFMDEDRIYNHSLGEVQLQNVDLGIGMRHFHEAAAALGLAGRWRPLPIAEGVLYSDGSAPAGALGAGDRLSSTLRYGEERGWTPIALWA